jgi:hypothetical protein
MDSKAVMEWARDKFRSIAPTVKKALSGDPETDDHYYDGDTPDDTHICRALRMRYKDKRLPGWLPRDPKAPHTASVQENPGPDFSKLFGDTPKSTQEAPPSLRQGRGKIGKTASDNPYVKQQEKKQELTNIKRPLPSQIKGSQQAKPMSAGVLLAKKKGRPESPSTLSPPIGQGRNNNYGSYNAASSYESSLEQRDDLYRGGGKRGAEHPVMGANSPWANNDNEFGGGGYNPAYDTGSQGGGYRIQQGLPTNPSSGRRGPGLPNGPRRGYI